MTVVPNEIIPYAFFFIILIFILANKKSNKSSKKVNENKLNFSNDENKRQLLENAEKKLYALKDLYKQELIDTAIYLKKTELIALNLSNELGNDIMELSEIKKKLIYSDLKKEIERKIHHSQSDETKTDIDNLIIAVDKRIKSGNFDEKK